MRTREYSWHQSSEHQEQEAEEQETGVVVGLWRFITDVEIQQANQNARYKVRCQSQFRQRLHEDSR